MDIFKTYIIPFLVFIFIVALAKYGVREYFRYDRLSNTGITVEMCNEIVNNISFPLKVEQIPPDGMKLEIQSPVLYSEVLVASSQ